VGNSLVVSSAKGVLGRLSVAVVAVALWSCATVPSSPEAAVKQKAQARWDLLVKGDFNAAYGYMSPGSRSIITAPEYAASLRAGFWKSAVVDKVECGSAQSCDVSATIEYEHLGRRTKTPLRETWIREGQEWWYLRK
jgi:phospholipase C